METSKLLEYLSIIIDLEKSKYAQEQTIRRLNDNISSYKKEYDTNIALNRNIEENAACTYNTHNIKVNTSGKGLMYFMVYYIGCLGASLGVAAFHLTQKLPFALIIGFIGAIIGGCIPVIVWKNILKKRKEQAIIQKQKGCQADIELKESRELRNKDLLIVIPKLDAENKAMTETYQFTCQTLQKCYDVGVIPMKYRSIVPVCMFYDYISNGRTYSITRNPVAFDEGAINMYEEELFKKEITDKMNTMICNLEAIRHNQKIIYNAIQDGNRQTHKLLSDINNNITQTNKNLHTIQYQNEQLNKHAEYLSWVAYQKFY